MIFWDELEVVLFSGMVSLPFLTNICKSQPQERAKYPKFAMLFEHQSFQMHQVDNYQAATKISACITNPIANNGLTFLMDNKKNIKLPKL